MRNKNPKTINKAIKDLTNENNLFIKTITCDNGIEFEEIAILAYWLKIIIYKAEPYASFQRGSNEHANGLIRRFYPKGFDFNLISDDDLQNTISKINSMPREIFNWKSALEVFNDNLVI